MWLLRCVLTKLRATIDKKPWPSCLYSGYGEGDHVAAQEDWQCWFDEHGGSLLLFARQWGASRSDAEDILQDAFVRFWKHRRRVSDPAAYLFRSVRNAALNQLRAQASRRRRHLIAADPASVAAPTVRDGELLAAIETALGKLPVEQREVLVMKIWGGLTFEVIATVAGIPSNTAASRYRYALAALRYDLSPELIL